MHRKNSLSALLVLFIMFFTTVNCAAAVVPEVVGEAAVLMDSKNGQVLFEKSSSLKVYPASTTKVLTAIMALESGRLADMVTVRSEACNVEGSAVGLQAGERISLEDLVYALLLNSGNDTAVAIACHLGGSTDGFVQAMNKRASDLGAVNTHFSNPNGLPDPGHYSTAYDMALISRYAMQNPEFRTIVSTKNKTIRREDPKAQTYLENHNRLLWRYNGANGIKTGYTDEARQCLLSCAAKQDRELIAVVIKSEGENIWTDSTKLLDYGFNEFTSASLVESGKFVADVPVGSGVSKTVAVRTANSVNYDFPREKRAKVREEVNLGKMVSAPVSAGEKLGELSFFAGGQKIGKVDLVAGQNVRKSLLAERGLWLSLALAGILLVSAICQQNRARRKRWKEYNRRKDFLLKELQKDL